MRNATRTALVAVSAVAAVFAVAVAAYAGAGTLQGTLSVSPSGGHYGDEITISPSMNTTAYPGDAVDIQYLAADNTWQKYGEGLSVEDTTSPSLESGLTTIGPLSFIVDESLSYPAVLRAYFTPKDSAEGTAASSPVWLKLYKNTRTVVKIAAPASATHGRRYVFTGSVLPISGVGTISATVKRVSSTYTYRYRRATDDSGIATFNFTPKIAGRYVITEKFLGNRFGVPSAVATRIIVVK